MPMAPCRLPNAVCPMPAPCRLPNAARLVRQHAHPHPHPKPKPNPNQHAHRIKGAAGNLGLTELQETCALLEHNAREGVWSAQMLPEIREVVVALALALTPTPDPRNRP